MLEHILQHRLEDQFRNGQAGVLFRKFFRLYMNPSAETEFLDIDIVFGVGIFCCQRHQFLAVSGNILEIPGQSTGNCFRLFCIPADHVLQHEEAVVKEMGIDLCLQLFQLCFLQQHCLCIVLFDQCVQLVHHVIEALEHIVEVRILRCRCLYGKVSLLHLYKSHSQLGKRSVYHPIDAQQKEDTCQQNGKAEGKYHDIAGKDDVQQERSGKQPDVTGPRISQGIIKGIIIPAANPDFLIGDSLVLLMLFGAHLPDEFRSLCLHCGLHV